ncbi:MAG: TldD/PmbA family protein [Actinomycetia bacterium]|nr:TldD/PmbA family protein [Actinomycetes bacterium]
MLDRDLVEAAIAVGLSGGADFAEVFVEDRQSVSAFLDDGRVEELTSGRDRGAGIRVISGETTGYAHTADLSAEGLRHAAAAAAAVSRSSSNPETVVLAPSEPGGTTVVTYPETVPKATKVAMLRTADDAARAASNSISQASARYSDGRRKILIANSEGVWATDDQVRTLFSVSCVASGDTGMQTGRESIGHTMGFELFDEFDVADLAERVAKRATTKLAAKPSPSGELPVVIKRGGGGVLFHEACGHGLEADLISKGASVFKDRVGEQVANPDITLIDDGTMAREWGHFSYDDEGHAASRNTLIENGVLTDYMWDHIRARTQGRGSSGNGRRQSYQHLPMVRMTNTYVLNGREDPDEIIAQTPYGVYVAQLGGGQVNTATGDFVFGMLEAYLIEDGKITEPLREGNLIGNGPKVLHDIDALGNDFEMGHPGMCGKDGQGVPVGDGQPTLRVSRLTVGGTAA